MKEKTRRRKRKRRRLRKKKKKEKKKKEEKRKKEEERRKREKKEMKSVEPAVILPMILVPWMVQWTRGMTSESSASNAL